MNQWGQLSDATIFFHSIILNLVICTLMCRHRCIFQLSLSWPRTACLKPDWPFQLGQFFLLRVFDFYLIFKYHFFLSFFALDLVFYRNNICIYPIGNFVGFGRSRSHHTYHMALNLRIRAYLCNRLCCMSGCRVTLTLFVWMPLKLLIYHNFLIMMLG